MEELIWVYLVLEKKKEEKTESKCSCGSCQTPVTKGAEIEGDIKRIRVLGSGCKNCHTLLENTKEAVKNMGMDTEVEDVTDMGGDSPSWSYEHTGPYGK